ncbi:MAG: [FeFe] hydrogenase large subunit, fused to signal transduction histidine kinase [Candidatus Ozemobacter sibiricus]|jgi:signal transduction histidine kinase/NAD-dependent dihydropyrimidine dehydrogenase PreA subunit|uniref:histidine kinase n=1 Tax=Candidatus Ozemobacter sibiricus TaxID=2268124 RepID=A0A367ZN70_9BACT|nr:MAG: [FeFe] hydrogenase large subunit, fused to signal transduction histidine kinase [Candidatus Ozemobacter sibiricus]
MAVVRTSSGKCKRCYTCVRQCPVKAISVEQGMAQVIEDFCVSCGTCVRVCNQKAKEVDSDVERVRQAFAANREVVALIAPSFPASFHFCAPTQVVAALKILGFSRVVEVAYGAELVARESRRLLFNPAIRKPLIASPCPVVVFLIEKHFPHLLPHLAPIVSPVIAIGRYLRARETGTPATLVFIGPCIAKKQEIRDPSVAGIVDLALTFREVKEMLRDRGLDPSRLDGVPADPPHPGEGRVFPLVGGILKAGGIGTDILDRRIAIIEGHHETMEFLSSFEEHAPDQEFIDILFCRGCIDGVEIDSDLSYLQKHRKILELVGESRHLNPSSLPEVPLTRRYEDRKRRLVEPTEEQINLILTSFGKRSPEDQLNCGACGYRTCRDKARAVFHGFAEPEMCLPHIIRQLEESCTELQRSHEELKKAQDELVHSEKLASLGQLSAGVAHELNNPLGGILLFSNILLDRLKKERAKAAGQGPATAGPEAGPAGSNGTGSNGAGGNDPGIPEELDVIVKEATRCRNIVRGLLDFARQSKLQRTHVDLVALLREIIALSMRTAPAGIKAQEDFPPDLPPCLLDPVQIRQALTNLINNAIEAMPNGGVLTVAVRPLPERQQVEVTIADTGVGIPEENLSKLFTPFYTTKGIGKGTGLGLAITYGIVKMHRGTITVQSKPGEGTRFTIVLPVENGHSETPIGFHGKF